MTVRKYSSRSQQTTLSSPITSTATTMTVVNGASIMGGKTLSGTQTYTVVIDPDTALEEIVDVTVYSSGNTLTITRGVDGPTPGTGLAHSAGAVVRHMAIGRDYQEANDHIESLRANSATAHGIPLATIVLTSDTGTVANGMIATNAVTTAKITDANVTTAKIADSAVTSAKIADLTIATGDIADSAITSGKIATGAVGTTKIDDLSITTAKIVDSGITAAKIASDAVTTAKILDANVTTAKIADSAITSAKIADGTIATADIADSAITSAKIADGTIVAGDLADGAVTSAKILDDTIVNADINSAAAIDKTKISGTAITAGDTGTVTSTMIADGTIVNGDISATAAIAKTKLDLGGTITSADLVDGTIVNSDINASAGIALSKLATDPLARANHTGTQAASTVSDFDTQVRTSRLDQMAAPTAAVALNAQKITGLQDPTSAQDAVTLNYITTQKGVANGLAELDGSGLVPTHHLPALAITTTQVVSTQAAMLALTAQIGDVAVRTDVNKSFILTATPATTLANWQELLTPTDSVLSVDGSTGAVSLSGTYLNATTGTLLGNLAAGGFKITGLGTPTSDADSATKAYVDTVAGSATAAAASAAAAATTYDNFDDRYLGAKASAPTLDNDGNAIIEGALYWNSTDNAMYAWDGAAWGSISSTAAIYRFRYTATAGQTSVSGADDNGVTLSYLAGKEQVYLNGVLLARTSDYTATNGTSITSLAALALNDIVEIITFTAFDLATAIPNTVVDAKGDLIVGTAADTVGKITAGTNGQYLQADSSTATGLKWAAVDLSTKQDVVSGVSSTEIGYLDGVTSAIQTQIDSKAPTSTTVTLTGSQTLTNKTLTTPVISSISNTGTVTLPTATDTLVGRATTDTLTNKTLTSPIIVSPEERTTVSATAATGTVNFDAITQGVLYYTSNASANWTLNVRGDSGTALNSVLATGDAITVSFLVTNGGTAYRHTALTIDGSAVTPKWSGGTAPAAGNASSIDAYSFTIVKTASATYTVFGAGPIKYA